mgnify:CR=1 FL=1
MEGIDFAASLCDLINNNKSQLSKINVEGNKLGAKGLGVFSRALRKNKTLTTLDISDNAINVDYEPKNFAIFSNGLTSFGEAPFPKIAQAIARVPDGLKFKSANNK